MSYICTVNNKQTPLKVLKMTTPQVYHVKTTFGNFYATHVSGNTFQMLGLSKTIIVVYPDQFLSVTPANK